VELAALAIALAAVLNRWRAARVGSIVSLAGGFSLSVGSTCGSWLLPDGLSDPCRSSSLALLPAFLFNPDQLTNRALGAGASVT